MQLSCIVQNVVVFISINLGYDYSNISYLEFMVVVLRVPPSIICGGKPLAQHAIIIIFQLKHASKLDNKNMWI